MVAWLYRSVSAHTLFYGPSKINLYKYFYFFIGPPGGTQYFTQIDKEANGNIKQKELMGVMYVPLTDKSVQVGRKW